MPGQSAWALARAPAVARALLLRLVVLLARQHGGDGDTHFPYTIAY